MAAPKFDDIPGAETAPSFDSIDGPEFTTQQVDNRQPDPAREAELDQHLENIFQNAGTGDNVERTAAIYKLQKETGADHGALESHFEEINQAWKSATAFRAPTGEYESPGRRFRKNHPELAEMLLRDPSKGWVTRVPEMNMLERALNAATEVFFTPVVPNPESKEGQAELDRLTAYKDSLLFKSQPQMFLQDEQAKKMQDGWIDLPTKGQLGFDLPVPRRAFVPVLRAKEKWDNLEIANAYDELKRKRWLGSPTEELERKILDLEQHAVQRDYQEGPIEQIFTDAADAVASFGQMVKTGGPIVGAVSGLTYVAALAATKNPAAAGELALQAGSITGKLTGIAVTHRLEGGSAYRDMLNATKPDGSPAMDEPTARVASDVYALFATPIEFASWGPMLDAMGPVGAMLKEGEVRAFTEALVKNPTFVASVKRIAGNWAKSALAEGGEEFLQDATQQAVEYFARSHAAGAYLGSGDPKLQQSLHAAALGTTGGLVMGGSEVSVDLATQRLFADQALVEGNKLRALANMPANPAAAAAPAAIAELFQRHAEKTGGPVEHLYVTALAFVRLFQDLGADPDHAARELLGPSGPQQLADAMKVGGKLEVPAEKYVERWVPTEAAKRLVDDTTTSPLLLTTREATTRAADIEKAAQDVADKYGPKLDEMTAGTQFDRLEEALVADGRYTPHTAKLAVAPLRAIVRTAAEVFGVPAQKLFEKYSVVLGAGDQALSLTLGAPAASRYLTRAWLAMTPTEQLRAKAIDTTTGALNERAWERIKPNGRKVAVISVEGVKYSNDKSGHVAGNAVYQAAAQALAPHAPELAKVKGDFAVYVKDEAELGRILTKANADAGLKGFRLTGAVGADMREASSINNDRKAALERAGERAARGAEPLSAEGQFVGEGKKLEGTRVSDELAKAFETKTEGEGFEQTYVEPETGLLNKDGFDASPAAKFQATLDLDGVKELNEVLGPEQVDELIVDFGNMLREAGGHEYSAAHISGDEFQAKGDDEAKMKAWLNRASELAAGFEREVELSARQRARLNLPAEGPVFLRGLPFSFGVGQTVDHAEQALIAHKAERQAAGLRGPGTAAVRLVGAAEGRGEGGGRGTGEVQGPGPVAAQAPDFGRQRFFDVGRLEQSVDLRTGLETLKALGLEPGEAHTTRDIAIALEQRQRKKYGTIARDDRSAEASKKISKWMADEVAFEFRPENRARSGVGWYSKKWQAALDAFAGMFPELKKDKAARNLFTALAAVTSDGQKVYTNLKTAAKLYAAYKEGGKVPLGEAGSQRGGFDTNLQRINDMLEQLGPERMHKELLREMTVSELRQYAKGKGLEFSTEYKADQRLPMAAVVFGPKLGAFYANLMGADGYLTMDRWWSRTFNRYRGQLVPAATRPGLDRFKQLLGRPNIDDWEAILLTTDYRRAYEDKNFKSGTELEKAANTIYKAEFEELEDTPFNAGDRAFMIDTTRRAQEELERRGIKVSTADIQAILWYYEKRLYAQLGARSSADVSYEEVAKRIIAEQPGGEPRGRAAQGLRSHEVAGPDGAAFDVPDEPAQARGRQSRVEQFPNSRLEAPTDQGVPRGYTDIIATGIERVFRIALNKNADMSTLLHESGHVFLEIFADLAERPDAPARIKDDWARTLKWLGVEKREDIKREHHEKLAKGFEVYLREGKAPSPKLVRAFERFKLWLKKVYRDVKSLGVELNDDIRGVFDRLLATENELAKQARAMGSSTPYAKDALGMSEAEYQEYLDHQEDRLSHVQQQVDFTAIKERERELELWWKEELKLEKDQASEDYEVLPARRAQQTLLGKGELWGAKSPRITLRREDVVAAVGEEKAKEFLTGKDGVDPAEVSDFLGYGTPRAMLEDIVALPEKAEWVKNVAERAMQEKHPDVLADRSKLKELVGKGLHGDMTERWLLKELVALRAKVTPPGSPMWTVDTAPIEVMQLAAKKAVERMPIGRLSPGAVVQQERAAREAALKAAAKGDYGVAFIEQQRALVNMYTWRELTAARDEREAFLEHARELTQDKARARLGKAAAIYRDSVDALLEALGLKSPQPETPGVSIADLVDQLDRDGQTIGFDEDAINAIEVKPRGYKELTVAEMRHVDQVLSTVQAAARGKTTVLVGEKRLDAEEYEAAAIEEAGRNLPPVGPISSTEAGKGPWEKLKGFVAGYDAALLRVELMARWLGPKWEAVISAPLQAAKVREDDLLKSVIAPVVQKLEAAYKAARHRFNEPIDGRALFPTHAVAFNQLLEPPSRRFELLVMALHCGTESSLVRLLEGRNITQAQVMKALELLTKEELDLVQAVWDASEALWPLASELEERDSGLKPKRLERRALITSHGTYPGGYFPAIYDWRVQAQGKAQAANTLAQLLDPSYVRPGTARSHLKSRVEGFTGVLSLEPGTILRSLSQVAHDIAFREAVKSAGAFVMRPAVEAELTRRLGQERAAQFLGYIKDAGQMRGLDGAELIGAHMKLVRLMKAQNVVAVLGYSATTAAGDMANLLAAVPRSGVSPWHIANAVFEMALHPFETRARAEELSGELRHRREGLLRKLRQQVRDLPANSFVGLRAFRWMKDHAFAFLDFTDLITSTPVWLASYRQNLAKGTSEIEARKVADAVIRDNFPSSSAVDLPAVLRDKGWVGQSLMFYRYFSVVYNSVRDMLHPLHTAEDGLELAKRVPVVSGRTLAFLSAAIVFSELLSGRGPEGDEEWWQWYLRKLFFGSASSVPILGDAASAVESSVLKKHVNPRASPVVGLLTQLGDGALKLSRDDGEDTARFLKLLTQTFAPPLGIPTSQPLRTGSGLMSQVEDPARNAFELGSDVLYGRREGMPKNLLSIVGETAEGTPR